ncbi:MAG: hypothetical protein ABR946_02150, partial [Solirubrobacteraceae bacterium]
MTMVTNSRVSFERKSVRRLRWSLRVRRMMLWMVAAIGVFALVLLITAMRGPHKTLQRSAVKPRRHG